MLTGRPPFEGRSSEDIFALIERYTKGGAKAAANLQRQLSMTAASLSGAAGDFLIGLVHPPNHHPRHSWFHAAKG